MMDEEPAEVNECRVMLSRLSHTPNNTSIIAPQGPESPVHCFSEITISCITYAFLSTDVLMGYCFELAAHHVLPAYTTEEKKNSAVTVNPPSYRNIFRQ